VKRSKAKATDAEVRAMLNRLRAHLLDYSNCPLYGEVDFTDGKPVRGEHEDWCFLEDLVAMQL
jgi:hypothetical protein